MPLRVRGKAVGLCTAMNWGPANVLSAFLTPQMISSSMGPGGTVGWRVFGIPYTQVKTTDLSQHRQVTHGQVLGYQVPLFF